MIEAQRRRLLLMALILVTALWGGAWHQIGIAPPAQDVEVLVARDAGAPPLDAEVVYVNAAGYEYDAPLAVGRGADDAQVWRGSGVWVREIKLSIAAHDLEWIKSLEVRIGAKAFLYQGADLLASWRPTTLEVPPPDPGRRRLVLAAPVEVRGPKSSAPAFRNLLNWPGDGAFLGRVLRVPAAVAAALVALFLLGRALMRGDGPRRFVHLGLGVSPQRSGAAAEAAGEFSTLWLGIGAAVLAGAYLVLRSHDRFYFVEDDNFLQFLPVILHHCSALAEGVFPTFNPYQYLGQPTLSVGTYALTYPPMWLACAVAAGPLGRPEATFEVFAVMHLGAGYVAAFWAGRSVGLRPSLASATALSFTLSGYFLISGRAWYYMLPVALWLPLLVVAIERLRRGASGLRWALLTGGLLGAFYHAGNVQMWSYAILMAGVALGLAWHGGGIRLRELQWAAAALLIGAAIAAPLMVPQMELASGLKRIGGGGHGILPGAAAMLLPYPLVTAAHPDGWGNFAIERMGHFYYSGTVMLGAALAALVMLIALGTAGGLPRRTLPANLWLVCGGVALLLALGRYTPLWPILASLPGFSYFNHPFKFLPFVILFLCLGGAGFLEQVLRRPYASPRFSTAVALSTGALLLYHAAQASPSTYRLAEDPYPPLPSALSELRLGASGTELRRVFPISPWRTTAGGYAASMAHNLATYYRVPSLDGYDPLVLATAENRAVSRRLDAAPLETLRAYGVRWLIRFDPRVVTTAPAFERLGRRQRYLYARAALGGETRFEGPDFRLVELAGSSPLAFEAGVPAAALPVRLLHDRVLVALAEGARGRPTVLNFLARPGVRVRADGVALEVTADQWGRVVVTPPQGARALELDYRPGWGRGLMAAAALALIALALVVWLSRRSGARAGP